jgi:hypothetical protein
VWVGGGIVCYKKFGLEDFIKNSVKNKHQKRAKTRGTDWRLLQSKLITKRSHRSDKNQKATLFSLRNHRSWVQNMLKHLLSRIYSTRTVLNELATGRTKSRLLKTQSGGSAVQYFSKLLRTCFRRYGVAAWVADNEGKVLPNSWYVKVFRDRFGQ